MSCIALLPGSLSKIQQSISKLIAINTIEIIKAENAIRFEVELEINIENKNMTRKGAIKAMYLTCYIFLLYKE